MADTGAGTWGGSAARWGTRDSVGMACASVASARGEGGGSARVSVGRERAGAHGSVTRAGQSAVRDCAWLDRTVADWSSDVPIGLSH
jgi:hypothetical protein